MNTIKIKNSLVCAVLVVIFLSNGPMAARVVISLVKQYLKKQAKEIDISQDAYVNTILSRLYKSGLVIKNKSTGWEITEKGKTYAQLFFKKEQREKSYENFKNKNRNKRDTIVMFDIPEHQKKNRNILRYHLVMLGYERLQKSVWIGGSPLPAEFIEYLKISNLFPSVHIFRIMEKGSIGIG